jgi:hypothetical protein
MSRNDVKKTVVISDHTRGVAPYGAFVKQPPTAQKTHKKSRPFCYNMEVDYDGSVGDVSAMILTAIVVLVIVVIVIVVMTR